MAIFMSTVLLVAARYMVPKSQRKAHSVSRVGGPASFSLVLIQARFFLVGARGAWIYKLLTPYPRVGSRVGADFADRGGKQRGVGGGRRVL